MIDKRRLREVCVNVQSNSRNTVQFMKGGRGLGGLRCWTRASVEEYEGSEPANSRSWVERRLSGGGGMQATGICSKRRGRQVRVRTYDDRFAGTPERGASAGHT